MIGATVMLTAVEPSADALGAALARAIRQRLPDREVRFVGVGGELMAGEGIASPFPITDLAVVGVFNAAAALPRILACVSEAAALARRERPQVAVLIDSWGFSAMLAARLRRLEPRPRLVKYVAPQVWASRPWRARAAARLFERILTIQPFEAPLFDRAGGRTTFVGNPVLALRFAEVDPALWRRRQGFASDAPVLLVLPGSRRGEVERLMRPFGQAVAIARAQRPGLEVVVAPAEAVVDEVSALMAAWPAPARLLQGEEERREAMAAATLALACSGTVTSELAQAGCPMVVAYRMGPLTYAVAKLLLITPHVTILNIAADRRVAPELIQSQCAPAPLAHEVLRRLDDPALRAAQIADQGAALDILRGGVADPVGAAADAVIDEIRLSARAPR